MDLFDECAPRASDWEHSKQEGEPQEARTPGVEYKHDIRVTRADELSHSVKSRVPGVRVKGLKTDYVIIRGRKGKRGEKVVVLGAGQEWTDPDPPITVHSETEPESDTDGAPRRRTVQTYRKIRESRILKSDSEDDSGLELSMPAVRDGGGYILHQRSNRSGERADSFDRQEPNHERDRDKSITNEMESNSTSAEGEVAEKTAVLQTRDSSDDVEVTREGRKPVLQAKGKELLHSAVLIQCDSDYSESDSESDESEPGRTRRHNGADDSDGETVPSPSKHYAHIVEPGKPDSSRSNPKFDNNDETGDHQVDLLSLDPRTRVNQLRKMFHDRRRFYNVEESNRVRSGLAGSGNEVMRSRGDLKAYTYIDKQVARVKGNASIVGEVPGTEVGDYFFYRIELLLVGLHRQVQGGIDFIPTTARQQRYFGRNGEPLSVAVSVVSSRGTYENVYQGETLIYTGQGNNSTADQPMLRGNLALKNSCDLGLSVRVVRGVEVTKGEVPISLEFEGSPSACSPSGFLYIYDGLYRVEHYYQDRGSRGYKIWKFKLVRQPDQKDITDFFKGLE